MDWTRDVPQTKAWVLWINFVRDEYAKIHNIHSREATARLYALPKAKADMLIGLFNSQTGHYEAAKQIGA